MRRIDRWHTTKPLPNGMTKGDTVFMWENDPRCTVVALGELVVPNAGPSGKYRTFKVRYLTNQFPGPNIRELRRVRGISKAYFLKAGPSQTIYPLTRSQGRQLQSLAEEKHAADISDTAMTKPREEAAINRFLGAGFGSVEENRRVERAAIRTAVKYLRAQGWSIESKERDRVGYDLDCIRMNRKMHVEVKGIRGDAPKFILTAGEHTRVRDDGTFALCIVTRALAPNATVELVRANKLGERLTVTPLAYKATLRAGV